MITSGIEIMPRNPESDTLTLVATVRILDAEIEDTRAAAITNAASWNSVRYSNPALLKSSEPKSGPMVNPATKNPTNLAMFRTLSAPELTLEIIASQGGQKNACAMPVPILHTMISGTVCTMESAYVDTAFRATPAVRIHPRLNLSSSIPTNSGTKMYGAKFATPMAPISEYVAPIVSEANIGSIGLCMP